MTSGESCRTVLPIEIIGGGLAGLSLGLALRREGVPVTLFDTGRYPRHRVCGEFISGLSAATIENLGLAPLLRDAKLHRDVAWFAPGSGSPIRQRLPAPAIGLSRHALDTRIAEAFVAAGGELREGVRSAETADRPGRVFATGRRRTQKSPWLGLKVHVRGLDLPAGLEVHLGADCYVGLTTVEDGTVNVCGLFRRRPLRARGPQLLLQYCEQAGLTPLVARLNAATILPETACAVAALEFDHRAGRTAGIHLGDSCATIPPFTGNGMAMAFQSAETALDPLLAYSRGESTWPDATRLIQRRLARRFSVRLGSAGALHSFLLHPSRQRWLARAHRSGLLPLRPLYALLH